jgi:hypothetical protein
MSTPPPSFPPPDHKALPERYTSGIVVGVVDGFFVTLALAIGATCAFMCYRRRSVQPYKILQPLL